VDLAFHDAESASAGFFEVGARHHSAGAPDRAVPLTPPSLPAILLGTYVPRRPSGLPRSLLSSLREDETHSTTRDAFPRWGTPTPVRGIGAKLVRVHVCLRDDLALGALHPRPPELCFRAAQGYRKLDPRPCPSPRLALFTRDADRRFSGSGHRPTTSATNFRRTDALPSTRSFAFRAPRVISQ
jgi:hypothetical protein